MARLTGGKSSEALEVIVGQQLVGELCICDAIVDLHGLRLATAVRDSAGEGGVRLLSASVVKPLIADAYVLCTLHQHHGGAVGDTFPVVRFAEGAAQDGNHAALGVEERDREAAVRNEEEVAGKYWIERTGQATLYT